MFKYLVSVIMPTYNKGEFIGESINSVLNQTYKNIELIIIDDSSDDNSAEIISSFKDSRIKYFKNDIRKGAAFCRNLALSKAEGDYIAFLDSDDLWDLTKIEKHLDFMVKNSIDFSYTAYSILGTNKIVTGPKKALTHKDFIKTDYVGCLTVMYKKSVYPDLQIPDTIKKRNDYCLWIKLSEKVNCHYFDENLSFYRRGSNSLSSNKFSLVKSHYFLFREVLHFSKLRSLYCAIRNIFYYLYRKIRFNKCKKKDKKKNHDFLGLIFSLLLFFVGNISFYFVNEKTTEAKLDKFCYELVDFYNINYEDNTNPVLLNFTTEECEPIEYSSLQKKFTDKNYVNGCRRTIDSKSVINKDGFLKETKLIHQDTFSIKKTSDGINLLDNNEFQTYFADEVLGYRGYLNRRNGADEFIFISDNLADKLCNFYHLEPSLKSYKEIITNPSYSNFDIFFDNTKKINFCINNVIYSKSIFASNIVKTYGEDFSLVCANNLDYKNNTKQSIDISLKTNPYTNRMCLSYLMDAEFQSPKKIRFNTFDYDLGKYSGYNSKRNDDLAKRFNAIYSSSDNQTLISIFLGSIFIFTLSGTLILSTVLEKNLKYNFIISLTSIVSFVVFGILACFTYFNYFLGLALFAEMLAIFMLNYEGVFYEIKHFFKKRNKKTL